MAVRRPWGGDRGPYSDGADDEDDVLTGAPRRMRFDDGEDGDVPHMGTKIGQMQLGQSSDVEYTMEKTRFTGHVPLVERTMIDRALSGETALWYATTTPAALYNGISAHFYMRERMMKYMMGDIPGDTEALAQTRMPQEERAYDLIAFARLVAGVAGEAVVHTVTLAYRVPLVGRMPPRSVLFFVFATEEERRLEALAKQANPDDRKKMVRDHGVFDHQTTADPPLVNYFHDPERSDTLGLAKPSAPPVSQQAGSSADAQQQQAPGVLQKLGSVAVDLARRVVPGATEDAQLARQSAVGTQRQQPANPVANTQQQQPADPAAGTLQPGTDNPALCPYYFFADDPADSCLGLWYRYSRDKYGETSRRRVLLASDVGKVLVAPDKEWTESVAATGDTDTGRQLLPVFIRCHVTFPPRFHSALRMAMDMSADGLCDQARRLLDRETNLHTAATVPDTLRSASTTRCATHSCTRRRTSMPSRRSSRRRRTTVSTRAESTPVT